MLKINDKVELLIQQHFPNYHASSLIAEYDDAWCGLEDDDDERQPYDGDAEADVLALGVEVMARTQAACPYADDVATIRVEILHLRGLQHARVLDQMQTVQRRFHKETGHSCDTALVGRDEYDILCHGTHPPLMENGLAVLLAARQSYMAAARVVTLDD